MFYIETYFFTYEIAPKLFHKFWFVCDCTYVLFNFQRTLGNEKAEASPRHQNMGFANR